MSNLSFVEVKVQAQTVASVFLVDDETDNIEPLTRGKKVKQFCLPPQLQEQYTYKNE